MEKLFQENISSLTLFFLSKKALKHHSSGHHGKKKKKCNRKLSGNRYIMAYVQTITAFQSSGNEFYYYIQV